MSRPSSFRELDQVATVGSFRLENVEKYVQPIGPKLSRGIFDLLARVSTEAERKTATLYDLKAEFEDDSAVLFSFKPYSNDHYLPPPDGQEPQRKDEIDIRICSIPFRGFYGESTRLMSILWTEDFRIERANQLVGGRKLISAPDGVGKDIPDWRDVDLNNIEEMCPVTSGAIIPWLGKLATSLDEQPVQDFERLAANHSLTF